MMKRSSQDGSIFMNSELVAKVHKNKLEEIRVSILKNNMVDVRIYFFFPGETEPKPTKKGVWLLFKQAQQIAGALEKLAKNPDEKVEIDYILSDKEKLRAYTGEYMNAKLFHIRTFYLKDNQFNPGKGISFPVALADRMRDALKQAGDRNESK